MSPESTVPQNAVEAALERARQARQAGASPAAAPVTVPASNSSDTPRNLREPAQTSPSRRQRRQAGSLRDIDDLDQDQAPKPGPQSAVGTAPTKTEAQKAQTAAPTVLVMPLSSFDFLEGRFRAAAKTRSFNVILAGLFTVVLAIVAINGVAGRIEVANRQQQLKDLGVETIATKRSLDDAQKSGAVVPDLVNKWLNERASQAITVAQNQVDVVRVLQAASGLPGQVSVTGINFSRPTTTGAAISVRITGTAPSLQAASSVATLLADPSRFTGVTQINDGASIQCSTSANPRDTQKTCAWTWTGDLSPEWLAGRTSVLKQEYPDAKALAAPALGEKKAVKKD